MNSRTLLNQQNLREVWEALEGAVNSNEASLMRSSLLRFTVPGLGGPKASGDRLKTKEAINALNFLATIPIERQTPEVLRAAQRKTFEILKTKTERQRQPRYYLNQFIKLGTERGFFANPSEKPKPDKDKYVFYPKRIKYVKVRDRINHEFRLSLNPEDYCDSGLKIEEVRNELNRIQSFLEVFESYYSNFKGNRKVTVDKNSRQILLLLGWLYREKQVSLSELSFNSLVPFINLNPKLRDFSDKENPWMEQMLAKAIAMEDIKEEANKLVDLLIDFFSWLKTPPSLETKRNYIGSLINLAKYIYRNQTDKTMAKDFEDIPLITRLRVFDSDLKKAPNSKSLKKVDKYIPWNTVLQVLEKLRFEADLTTWNNGIRSNGRLKFHRRPIVSIAKALQKFVLVGMFVLTPPPRQRVVRELELGRTLKYGLFVDGQFIPAEEMSNPSTAKYYIHLQPEDYKTGDTYGEWLGELPNVRFSNGKSFYDYLNRWLFCGYQDDAGNWHGMRELLVKGDTNTVFVKDVAGDSYDEQSMGHRIKAIFRRFTGVPVTPHDLRHIFRTYIEDPCTKATAEEKESAAFWMRHSDKTARKTYAHLDCDKKLRLGTALCNRINQQFLNS